MFMSQRKKKSLKQSAASYNIFYNLISNVWMMMMINGYDAHREED